MSKSSQPPPLTDAQLAIMNIVWDRREVTVGQVWRTLLAERAVARNTVLTLITRLEEKGGSAIGPRATRSSIGPPFGARPRCGAWSADWSTQPLKARPKDWSWPCWTAETCPPRKPSAFEKCSSNPDLPRRRRKATSHEHSAATLPR